MVDDTGLDFSDQIEALENKYQHALKDLYARLTIARHPNRPTILVNVLNITEKVCKYYREMGGTPWRPRRL
ncbi:hypothetical protein Ddye_023849 [Dipteronia dyeriana]|uniref:Uncharacterized protein n=1 Tax=Dipteronia dyeriana TaxID=168575 RepID=A0AAD9TTS5_9ROSI|nr:hypothetical protein Ddye_023849 [Dipteronia dyeriana]